MTDTTVYDNDNVFARIIRKEIESEIVYEDDKVLAFKDINPQARHHFLFIPKGSYVSYADFVTKASADEIMYFFCTINKVSLENGLKNYKLITNCGKEAGQEIFHFHVHILGD